MLVMLSGKSILVKPRQSYTDGYPADLSDAIWPDSSDVVGYDHVPAWTDTFDQDTVFDDEFGVVIHIGKSFCFMF